MRPLPLGRQLTYPSSPVQRIEYDRQDSAAPQRRRAPHQRLCRATGLCGGDPAGGRCPGGHSGIAAGGAALPTRPRQKRLVLARAHAPTGTREGAALVSREESGVVCGPRRSVDACHKHLARPSAQRHGAETLCHERVSSPWWYSAGVSHRAGPSLYPRPVSASRPACRPMWRGSGRRHSAHSRLVPQPPNPHVWRLSMSGDTPYH